MHITGAEAEEASGRGLVPSRKNNFAATPPPSRQKDGMTLCRCQHSLRCVQEQQRRRRRVSALPAFQGAAAAPSRCTCIRHMRHVQSEPDLKEIICNYVLLIPKELDWRQAG